MASALVWCLAGLTATSSASPEGIAGAVRDAPLGVVWAGRNAPDGFVARLRGQLSDLPWTVRRADGPKSPLPLGMIRTRLRPAPAGLELALETSQGWRIRSLAGLGESFAAYEAAAVVIRGVIRSEPVPVAKTVSAAEPEGLPVILRAGLRGETWGLGLGTVGLDATLGFGFGAWTAALGAQGSLPLTREDADLRLQVVQWGAFAAVDRSFVLSSALRLRTGLRGGVVGWWRSSEARATGIQAAPDAWTWGASVGPVLGASLGLGEAWALELALGVDALFGRPRFVLADGARVDEAWLASPWLRIGVEWDPIWWKPQ